MTLLMQRFLLCMGLFLMPLYGYADTNASAKLVSPAQAARTAVTTSGHKPLLQGDTAAPVIELNPQATTPLDENFRARFTGRLHDMWTVCKGKSATALGYVGSALGYGYQGGKRLIGLPYEINAYLYLRLLPPRLVSLLLWPCITGKMPFISIFSVMLKILSDGWMPWVNIDALYQGSAVIYTLLPYFEEMFNQVKLCWQNHNNLSAERLKAFVAVIIGFVVYCVFGIGDGLSKLHQVLTNPAACNTIPGGAKGALDVLKNLLAKTGNTTVTLGPIEQAGTSVFQKAVQKAYHLLSLALHPDKGGTAGEFIRMGQAVECLKAIKPA